MLLHKNNMDIRKVKPEVSKVKFHRQPSAYWNTSRCSIRKQKIKTKKCVLSCVWLFAAPRTVACQARLPMEFFRQEHWSGLPFPLQRIFPDPGIKPMSPALQAYSLSLRATWEVPIIKINNHNYLLDIIHCFPRIELGILHTSHLFS